MYTTGTGYDAKVNVPKIIKHAILAIIGLIIVFGSFYIVSPGEVGVVVRIGTVKGAVTAGTHLKLPLVDSVFIYNVQTQNIDAVSSSASSDLQIVNAKVAVKYNLDPTKVSTLHQTVGVEYKTTVVDNAIQEAIKSSTAKYNAGELITKRPLVREDMITAVAAKLAPYGIIGGDVSITDFNFSDSFNTAIEAKVTAEQNALASKNLLEQKKYEAEQRVVTAKGEAEAIRIQAEAIQSQGGAAYVELKKVERWDGHLPTYMMGAGTPLINIK